MVNPTEVKSKTEPLSVSKVPEGMSYGMSESNVAMPSLFSSVEPRRKTYAKESWPGKKPSHLLV